MVIDTYRPDRLNSTITLHLDKINLKADKTVLLTLTIGQLTINCDAKQNTCSLTNMTKNNKIILNTKAVNVDFLI